MEDATPKLMGIDPRQPFYIAVGEVWEDGSIEFPLCDNLIAGGPDKQVITGNADDDVGKHGGRVYIYRCELVSIAEPA